MYDKILVCLDNSQYSKYGEQIGGYIAKQFGSCITGFHVYSGKFHRMRFNALEEFLPDKYQTKETLDYQRKIHSVLIERGLEIISWEYMKELSDVCKSSKIPFIEKIVDGKNSDMIIDQSSNYDLTIIGAHGLGKLDELKNMGTNSQRLIRHSKKDVLVTKNYNEINKILVGIDGSVYARQMFEKVLDFAKHLGSEIKLVTVFDPILHQTVFSVLSEVLSDESGEVFKFKEQESLHNLVIDKSLEGLYQNYLKALKHLAAKKGVTIETELLTGKPVNALYTKSLEEKPDLVVVGRFGMHKGQHDLIGSTAENVAHLANTNVLIVSLDEELTEKTSSSKAVQKTSTGNYENVVWSQEAKKNLEKIPSFARPMATLAIERYATEKGHRIITPEIMKKARESAET
jgi:nucleotide-binding universal stress UspA family protein